MRILEAILHLFSSTLQEQPLSLGLHFLTSASSGEKCVLRLAEFKVPPGPDPWISSFTKFSCIYSRG